MGDELCRDGTLKRRFSAGRKAPPVLASKVSRSDVYKGIDGRSWCAPKGYWRRVPHGGSKKWPTVNPTDPALLPYTDCDQAPGTSLKRVELNYILQRAEEYTGDEEGAKQLYERAYNAYQQYKAQCAVNKDIRRAKDTLRAIKETLKGRVR